MYKKKETYIRKTICENIIEFKSTMNWHISDSRMGDSSSRFRIHVYKCGLKNKCIAIDR